MDFIIIGIVLLLILTIVFLFCYVVCTKGGVIGKVVIGSFSIFALYQIHLAFFPSDEFYKYDFRKVTGLTFPLSGKILSKSASFPDLHGDYESCALIQVSNSDYEILKISLQADDAKKDATFSITCKWPNNLGQPVSEYLYFKSIEKSGGEIKAWGILKGSNLVYIEYSSW